jgi:hypothetical protein
MDHLHWQHLIAKQLGTAEQQGTVLALANLGDTTQIGSFLLAKVSIYSKISQV